jgi:bifunctional DNA-binding transcriptional regulator/antitoxin component of YhaV-PrlF toxin-antitoxin module
MVVLPAQLARALGINNGDKLVCKRDLKNNRIILEVAQ